MTENEHETVDETTLTEKVVAMLDSESKARIAEKKWSRIRSMIIFTPAIIFTAVFLFKQGITLVESFGDEYVAYIELNGEISEATLANAKVMNSSISAAFKDKDAKGVLLRISSPGGSPTQSALIRDHIDYMREKHPEKRLIVVAEESMASGAYLIGSSADVIYASPSSIIGSIGVVMQGWDFSDALDRVDIKHRLFTAGENKARMSPFSKLRDSDVKKAHSILDDIHGQFIEYVTTGRGDRLKTETEGLFSGDFWLGSKAIEMGLIDKFGGVRIALDDEFDTQRVSNYTPQLPWHQRIGGQLGASIKAGLLGQPKFMTIQ